MTSRLALTGSISLLLGSTALTFVGASPAMANCQPSAPTINQFVLCDNDPAGTDSTGVQGGSASNVTIETTSDSVISRSLGVNDSSISNIALGTNATVTHSGEILAQGKNSGIQTTDDATITLLSGSRTVAEGGAAVVVGGGSTITIEEGATVSAGTYNSGYPFGNSSSAIRFNGPDGIVTNAGTVTATATALQFNGGGTFENHSTGLISSTGLASGPGTGSSAIVNESSLVFSRAAAPNPVGGDTTALIGSNAGIIRTLGSVAAIRSLAPADITNSGTIDGTGGEAILFSGNTNRLELQPGSVVNGAVRANGSNDTLVFGGESGTFDFDVSAVDGDNTDDGEQYLGFETFEKRGASTTNLTGTNTEIANVLVAGGLLNVNGSMVNTSFDVTGGRLGGSGTIGALKVGSGNVIAPGNSIGTLNVGGSLLFQPGSLYDVEIAADGKSDLIKVAGTATLNGGQVNPIRMDPTVSYTDTTYTILTADGGVTGAFAGVNNNTALVSYLLRYDANNVFLVADVETIGTVPNYPAFAKTYNQRQAATSLLMFDTVADPEVVRSLFSLDADALANAYDQVTGVVHGEAAASASGIAMGYSEFLGALASGRGSALGGIQRAPVGVNAYGEEENRQALDGRFDAVHPRSTTLAALGPSVWLGTFGSIADLDSDGNGWGYGLESFGLATGIETPVDVMTYGGTVGASIGYSWAELDVDGQAQSGEIETVHIGLYGTIGAGRMQEGLGASAAVSYAHHEIETDRLIQFGGLSRQAEADYGGDTISGDLELRYNLHLAIADPLLSGATMLSPFIRVQAAYTDTNHYSESGAGALNLSGSSQSYNHSSAALGVSLTGDYGYSGFDWKPSVSLAYKRLTGDNQGAASLNFAGSPTSFGVNGVSEDRDQLQLGVASEFVFSERASIALSADSAISEDRADLFARAGFKLAF